MQDLFLLSSLRAKSFNTKARTTWILLVLAGLIFVLIQANFYGKASAQTAPAGGANFTPVVRVQVKAGFDSYYKLNSWLPVQVNLTLPGNGSNFDGWLEASFTNFSEDSALYRRAVQLVPPASRQVWFYLPTGNRNLREVQVRLIKKEGVVLDTQAIPIQPLDQSELVVGVISDNTTALADLGGLRVSLAYNKGSIFYAVNYYSRTPAPGIIPSLRMLHLSPQDLPPDSSGWDSLDGLVLTNLSNATKIDLLQNAAAFQNAAAAWLVQGRFLFTSGDSGLTRSGFLSDFLPVKQNGVPQTKLLPDQMRPFLTPASTQVQVLTAQTSLLPGASAQLKQNDGSPFLAEKPFGLGRSWYSAADLSVLPDDALVAVWRIAFQDYEPHVSYTTGLRQPSDLVPPWTAQLSPNTKIPGIPDIGFIALTLGIYFLLLGPVSYFILKRLGKLELGWLVAPVLAVALTGAIYIVGELTGGEPLVTSRLSIVMMGETASGKMVGGMTSLETLYSNNRQSLDLKVTDQTQAVGLVNNVNGFDPGFTSSTPDILKIQQGPGGGFGSVFLGQDDQRSFALESAIPSEVGEGIVTDLSSQGNELVGTIENRSGTDWFNLSIWKSGNVVYRVPLIKAGEKMTLQKGLALNNPTDSLVLVLAGLVDGKSGTSNSALTFGGSVSQTQEVTILSTLLGNEGQVLPKGANRVYLLAWNQTTFDFPLQIGSPATSSKDLTLLFEPVTVS